MKKFFSIFLFSILVLLPLVQSFGISPSKTRLLIIFDCSGSMKAKWGTQTRMDIAKKILSKMMDSLSTIPDMELALRCYGHQFPVPAHNCTDSKLEIPFGKANAAKIKAFVQKVQPNGYTPIAYSLTQSASDFPDTRKKNVILLITDGIEECDGDPCEASKALSQKQVSLKPYVIGIGLSLEKMKSFDCVGKYYSPSNEKQLGSFISGVISNALENTTLQIELLDDRNVGTVSNVGFSLSDALTKDVKYQYIHTLDANSQPDTIILDPNYVYDLKINTIPAITKTKINLQTAHHNIVTLPAAQSDIFFDLGTGPHPNQPYFYLRKTTSEEIIYHGSTTKKVTVLQGNYNIEVLTLPRMHLSNQIVGKEGFKAEISNPGLLSFNFSFQTVGALFCIRKNGENLEHLADMEGSPSKPYAFYLQPGDYTFIYRKKSSKEMEEVEKVNFHIDSGTSKEFRVE